MRSVNFRFSIPVLPVAAAVLCLLTVQACGPSKPSVSGSGTFDAPPNPPNTPIEAISAEPSDWVGETLSSLTLEEKIAQMVFVRAYGYYQNDNTPRMRRLFDLVARGKVGGVSLFQGDVHTSALLINRLQEMSSVPLMVSADFEWGMAMRTRRSTRYPEAMALGASRDTVLAYEMGKRIAMEARSIGVHQVYGPVAVL